MKSQSSSHRTHSNNSKDPFLRQRQHISDDLTQCVGVSCLLQQTIEDHSKATKELYEFLHSKLRWIHKQWKYMKSVDFRRSSRSPIMEPLSIQEMSECIVICCNLMDSLAAVKQSEHTNLTGKFLGTLNQHVLSICRSVQNLPAESQIIKQDQGSLEKLKVLRKINEKNMEEEEDDRQYEEDTRKRQSSQTHNGKQGSQIHGNQHNNNTNNGYILINNISVIEDQNDNQNNQNEQKIKESQQQTNSENVINQNAFSNDLRKLTRQDQFISKNPSQQQMEEIQLDFKPNDVVVTFFPRDGSNSPQKSTTRLICQEINKNHEIKENEIQKDNQIRSRDNKHKSQLLGDGKILRQLEINNNNKTQGFNNNGYMQVVEIDDEEEELGNGQVMEIEEKDMKQQSQQEDDCAEVLMISSMEGIIEGNQQTQLNGRITQESQISQLTQQQQLNFLDVVIEDKQPFEKSPNIWNQENKDISRSQVSSCLSSKDASTSSHQLNHEMDNAICISDSSEEEIQNHQENLGESKMKNEKEEKEENLQIRNGQMNEFKLQDYLNISQKKEDDEGLVELRGSKRTSREQDECQKQEKIIDINGKLNSCNIRDIKEKNNSACSSLNHGIVRSMEALKINDLEAIQIEKPIGIREEKDNQINQELECINNQINLFTGKTMKIIRKQSEVADKQNNVNSELDLDSNKDISNEQQPLQLDEDMVVVKNDSLEDDQEHEVSYYVYKDNKLIRKIRKQNSENNNNNNNPSKGFSKHHNKSSDVVSTGSKRKIVKAQQLLKN